jgi:hypothetical protein
MSLEALSWALNCDGLKSTEKLVLICLANHADKEGFCFPSQRHIAKTAAITERAVRANIASLVDKGFISKEHRQRLDGSRTTDKYLLNVGIQSNRNHIPGDRNEIASNRNEVPPPRNETTIQPEPSSGHEPVTITKNNKPNGLLKKSENQEITEILLEVIDQERIEAFILHRKKLKKPLTPYAAKRIVNKLKECQDACQAIDVAIERGWVGIEPHWVENAISNVQKQATKQPVSHDQRLLHLDMTKGDWNFHWGPPPSDWTAEDWHRCPEQYRRRYFDACPKSSRGAMNYKNLYERQTA